MEQMQVAIVTGGSSGIGRGVVNRLASDGWTTVNWDLTIPAGGAPGTYQRLDVRDREAVSDAVATVTQELGEIGLLVNSAGTTRVAPTERLSWEDWSLVIDVNLHGTFNCLQSVGREMLRAGAGSIVNITSIAAERGGAARAGYCASKAGVIALTKVAGVEWAVRGVRVNAVGPGWTETPLLREAMASSISEEEILRLVPAGRLAAVSEIAAAVAFLASSESSYITGQVLWVDGGYLPNYGLAPGLPEGQGR